MAYVSKVWVDRQTEYPTRRKLAFDDGTGDKIVTVSREEGQIYEAGDIFDANTMNNMESRIAAGIGEKQNTLIAGNGIRIDPDNVISATGGGGGIEFTKIESGSLVSVNDAADLPVVDLAVEIVATQSGTGDPSPSNVRPISGFTGLNLYRTGVNLWDEEVQNGYYDTAGRYNTSNSYICSKNPTKVFSEQRLFVVVPSGQSLYICFYTQAGTFISRTMYTTSQQIVTPVGSAYFHFNMGSAYGNTYRNDVSINYPRTDTTYHAYTGTTVTIALGQTVYGGELDVTTGVLTITRYKYSARWGDGFSSTDMGDNIRRLFQLTLGCDVTTRPTSICDRLPWSTSYVNDVPHFYIDTASQRAVVFMPEDTDADTVIDIVYPLATPVTVQLTPTEVETLLGINNIWADSGDILNLEYYTQSASDVRDFIIKDEEVTDDASWSSEKIQDELDAKQETLTAGAGIVIDNNNAISAVLYTELTATLNVFSTSVVFEDSSITTDSVIDIYTSKYGFNPETVTAETGRLTLTFRQPEEQITVKVRIS